MLPHSAGNCLPNGKYCYMSDLVALNDKIPPNPLKPIPELQTIETPLKLEAWGEALSNHPDYGFVHYILEGLHNGFRIGFDYTSCTTTPTKGNMLSAAQHADVINEYLKKECAEGRILGPLSPANVPFVQVSRFGAIPKKNQQGKWRLITDLSSPQGHSVNDGIDPALCSLSYTSVDDAAAEICAMGRGTLLAKLDIKNAYRIVPVHPEDRLLLGTKWQGKLFIDTVLPFGLRSAPKIFNAIADALEWIFAHSGIYPTHHYLDDFIFFGRPGTKQCADALTTAITLCNKLGVPLALDKLLGPSTVLPFLGIELDTDTMELRLPADKLHSLQSLIKSWQGKKSCTKRGLLSLIGHLQHAAKVVKPGRTFVRRMIDLATTAKELHHHIRLNRGFQSDLLWWATFLQEWNGVGMLPTITHLPPNQSITSDASGTWGCAAFWDTCWFALPWEGTWEDVHITMKELLPIVLACTIWGKHWKGQRLVCYSDNAAVVAIINSGSSKNPLAMHLMRSLFFVSAHYKFTVSARFLPGSSNQLADALSRNNIDRFLSLRPQASRIPTPIPQELLQMLLHNQPDWTSNSWRMMFSSFMQKV